MASRLKQGFEIMTSLGGLKGFTACSKETFENYPTAEQIEAEMIRLEEKGFNVVSSHVQKSYSLEEETK